MQGNNRAEIQHLLSTGEFHGLFLEEMSFKNAS